MKLITRKSTPLFSYNGKLISYSQNLEDLKLYGYFNDLSSQGFYVDIGANHPTHDSVTKFFYLRGWKGVNIEPQKHLHALLRKERTRDKNLQIGISDKGTKAILRQYKSDGLSTFSTSLQKSYEESSYHDTNEFIEIRTKLKKLSEVLEQYRPSQDIHFLKVDVEGFEYEVLRSNDWKKFRPWVICVESTGHNQKWRDILLSNGYRLHLADGLNEYYVAVEKSELISHYTAYVVSETIRYDLVEQLSKQIHIIGGFKRRLRSLFKR